VPPVESFRTRFHRHQAGGLAEQVSEISSGKLLDVDRNTGKMLGARIRNHSAALNTEPNFSRSDPLAFLEQA